MPPPVPPWTILLCKRLTQAGRKQTVTHSRILLPRDQILMLRPLPLRTKWAYTLRQFHIILRQFRIILRHFPLIIRRLTQLATPRLIPPAIHRLTQLATRRLTTATRRPRADKKVRTLTSILYCAFVQRSTKIKKIYFSCSFGHYPYNTIVRFY
ncbi:hypothetical protein KP509_27G040200 [Ceratopteris richardii]|uniref:Uncharacterized protein n=1 Tax=Ceratopteris richardii TaxID=49495 RepID=A0A8T2RH27_CERRI|nr:hypothetical protein KP509_27G040200 [Ceratopteris richardii]